MADTVIELESVSKRFKLYTNPVTGPIKEVLFPWRRRDFYREVTAVKDVSLAIERGEVVGFVGPNGAGKTTLLKMIAGLLPVDHGRMDIHGKVTALLAMGVGFHPEFTGRENILYGGMLLGMSKAEVLRKMPAIIEFAELGDYIEQPFRTYSSGMKARLLFATSMSIDPDILVVDEALATGDAYFLDKSSRRIRELCDSGATILFVSHNLAQVEQLCDRAFLMIDGKLVSEGRPVEIVDQYHHWVFDKEKTAPLISTNPGLRMLTGTGEIVITDVRLKTPEGEEATGFYSGEPMQVEIDYHSNLPAPTSLDLFVGFMLTSTGQYVGEVNTVNYIESVGSDLKRQQITIDGMGTLTLQFDPLLLLNNHYALWLILYEGQKTYCAYKNVKPFFVARRGNTIMRDAVFWQPCVITSSCTNPEMIYR